MKVEVDSMLIWYPKIKDLPIPQPKTEFLILTKEELEILWEEKVSKSLTEKVKAICDKMGYPCFLRTDLASAKHSWKKSCFVENGDINELWKNIYEVFTFGMCADLEATAFTIREYILMDSKYMAFWGKMPVNPERRYFVKDGRVICHHPYWIEDAIEKPSVANWHELSKEMNTETEEEIKLLTSYAELVSKTIEGLWSVDFCKAKDGRWILIDMATAQKSWHPKDCKLLEVSK